MQEVVAQQQQQQPGTSSSPGAVHVMMDSQQIIKYEIIEAPSPTGGNGQTNTVTIGTAGGQHIGSLTPTSSAGGGGGNGAVVVTSNGSADGNGSDQME